MESIVSLLTEVLHDYDVKSKGNLAFFCPFCHHHKKKLEVHPIRGQWNCWVCGAKGRTIYSLFKRVNAPKHIFLKLSELSPNFKKFQIEDNLHPTISVKLPQEYTPLWIPNNKNHYYRSAIKYLSGRHITMSDILKYRLGYCEGGIYDGMIVIPNFNKLGHLNYFTTRSFLVNNSKKFINPPYSRDVVGLELQLNWDEPITICESALDAIVIKNNATPLYGKLLTKSIKLAILENEVKHINICLDPDAIQKAYEHSEYFLSNGVTVNFVKMPGNDDPSSLGYHKTWELIDQAKELTNVDIFSEKVLSKI